MAQRIVDRFLEKLEPYRHVIWDWNGTLLNDVHIAVDSIGDVMLRYHLPPPTLEQYRHFFGFPVQNYYERMGFDFSQVSFAQVSDQFHEAYEKRVLEAELFHGMLETLEQLGQQRMQSILSAAAQWHLESIVNRFGLHVHFTHIFGLDNNQAASKLARGRELLRVSGLPLEQTVLVGDTDHDLEVGRSLGIDVLLVADGHQHADRLLAIHHNVLHTRFSKD